MVFNFDVRAIWRSELCVLKVNDQWFLAMTPGFTYTHQKLKKHQKQLWSGFVYQWGGTMQIPQVNFSYAAGKQDGRK